MSGRAPGAACLSDGCCAFTVWAPFPEQVAVRLMASHGDRIVPLARGERGYHTALVDDVQTGARYFYVLDGNIERPDPASRFQPEGVLGPSEVCCVEYPWTDDAWRGIPLQQYVVYELHVGTFTPKGTFDAIIPALPALRDLGVTAVEFMPVAQFPGSRNWGYDGAYPYAVQNTYGGPEALKRLVDACHSAGLAAVLDVVYNHFGPEGNYAGDFAPYFTERYHTPWGRAINFDGPGSDEVRRFFVENALYWLREFHFDALRLDALHAILDTSATPFLADLSAAVQHLRHETGRELLLIGESDLNDPRLIRERTRGGLGLDAQWSDDFHHALHTLLTGERTGYYADFGTVRHLATAWHEGYAYTGQYSIFRQRRHGAPASDLPPCRFVVCAQNHDQVGNRAKGDRLSAGVTFEQLKLAAACVLLSPHIPLLFMGEEYGETAPFPYFVHNSDAALIEAVRKGRREEFAGFGWQGDLPDPQSESTFKSAVLHREEYNQGRHSTLRDWYRKLLQLRREEPLLGGCGGAEETVEAFESHRALLVRRSAGNELLLAYNFGDGPWSPEMVVDNRHWTVLLDSAAERWGGPGGMAFDIQGNNAATLQIQPHAFVLLSTCGS